LKPQHPLALGPDMVTQSEAGTGQEAGGWRARTDCASLSYPAPRQELNFLHLYSPQQCHW